MGDLRSKPMKRALAAIAVAALGLTTLAAEPALADPRFTPGAPGVGDPWNPMSGNGGYDVQHYDLDLAFRPKTGQLDGVTTIKAKATQNLSRFDLDLQQLTVHEVRINGREVRWHRDGQELQITPRHGLRTGTRFTVTVKYGGMPKPADEDNPVGFVPTDDGFTTTGGGDTASTWFPSNDHPTDKATFRIRTRVPRGLDVSNGNLISRRASKDWTTVVWAERAPMATYLVTVDAGHWIVKQSRTPSGIPSYVAVDPQLAEHTQLPDPMAFFDTTTTRVIDKWQQLFGPYPYESTGGIADYALYKGKPVPISQETQSRPIYSGVDTERTVAHELAHQWFGDSVTIKSWNEIWLSEGFATFAAWYWDEQNGQPSAHDQAIGTYDEFPSDSSFWDVVVSDAKQPTQLAGARVYLGGAMILQLLREKLGDHTFFRVLRAWATEYRYSNATTKQFEALATKVSGQDLGPFFRTWVYSTGKPPLPTKMANTFVQPSAR